MSIKNVEQNLVEECLILLTNVTRKLKDENTEERYKMSMPEYYETTINSLECVISVCNALLEEYKKK